MGTQRTPPGNKKTSKKRNMGDEDEEDTAESVFSLANDSTTLFSLREKLREVRYALAVRQEKCAVCDTLNKELTAIPANMLTCSTPSINKSIKHLTEVHKLIPSKKRQRQGNASHSNPPETEKNDLHKQQQHQPQKTPQECEPHSSNEFRKPLKTLGFKRMVVMKELDFGQPIPTSNRFANLPQIVDFSDVASNISEPSSAQSATSNASQNQPRQRAPGVSNKNKSRAPVAKVNKPPPIVVKGKFSSHKALNELFLKLGITQYTIRYARNSTIIYCELLKDWQNLINNFEAEELEHHTYAEKETKGHAFVLRGLEGDITISEITDELREKYNINPRKIFKMKTKFEAMYLVILDSNFTLKSLNQNQKIILNVRVTWENRKSERPVMVCKRCQGLGHAATYCKRAIKCSRCAGPHEITVCSSDVDQCANCGGNHRSIDENCPIYIHKIRQLEPRRRFVAAPPPKTPAWQPNPQQATRETQPSSASLVPRPQSERYDKDFPARRQRGNVENLNLSSNMVSGNQGDFLKLTTTMNEINSLVNITELLKALRKYVEILQDCKGDKTLIFQASMEFFTKEIHNFDF